MDPSVWLQVETKARIMVKELLEPTIRRVTQTIKQIDDLSQFQTTLNYKMEDIEVQVCSIEKRLSVIDEFSKKMNEFEAFQQIIDSKFTRDREEIKSQVLTFSKKQMIFEEDIQVLQKQKDSIKEDITTVSNVILNNKFEVEEQIEDIKKRIRDNFQNSQNRFEVVEQNVRSLEENLKSFSKDLVLADSAAKEAARIGVDAGKAVDKCERKLKDFTEKIAKDVDKVRSTGIINTSDVLKVRTEVKRLDEFVKLDESGTSLKLLFTEPLYQLFKDLPTLKILAEYDKDRVSMINSSIYSSAVREQIAKLKVKAQEIINTPLPIKRHDSNSSSVKRKRKERVKNLKKQMAASITRTTFLKKEQPQSKSKAPRGNKAIQEALKPSDQILNTSLPAIPPPIFTSEFPTTSNTVHHIRNFSNMPNEDSVNFPSPLRKSVREIKFPLEAKIENPSEQSEKSDALLGEKGFPAVITEAISGVGSEGSDSELDNFVDFTPMINMVKSQLETDLQSKYEELKSSIMSTGSSLSTSLLEVKTELINTILSIKSNHENYSSNIDKKIADVGMCVQQAVLECNSASAIRKRDHSDYGSQFKQFMTSFEEISKQEVMINEGIENLSKSLETIIEFCKINLALQGQDELDRESIFLMGSKEIKKGKVVSLDKRCLSCAGQSSSVIGAFKIACLAYEPSSIYFQDRRYSRKELINVQRNILKGFNKTVSIDTSEEREVSKGVMTSRHWRPLSVPISTFSTLTSPYLRTPDADNLPYLRKSLNN